MGRDNLRFLFAYGEILLRGTKVVNPSAGALRTISLLLRLGLFHVNARLRRSVPACIGTVIDAGVRVDPDLDIGVAQG
jgi:hypothetical protein